MLSFSKGQHLKTEICAWCSRPKSALGAASITSLTAYYYTSKSFENHQVACPIEVYSVEEYRCLMVLPERLLYQQEVSKRFLKTSRWSTYFVYVRTPKTRGFSEVFGRHFSYIFDVKRRWQTGTIKPPGR